MPESLTKLKNYIYVWNINKWLIAYLKLGELEVIGQLCKPQEQEIILYLSLMNMNLLGWCSNLPLPSVQ